MSKSIGKIRATVRQHLRDEFVTDQEYNWKNDELDTYIRGILKEISRASPDQVVETVKTTVDSLVLDISNIKGFLGLAPEHEIEYPVGNEPPSYHNATIFGKTIRMEIYDLPGADEDVYLYCHKLHTIDSNSSTLSDELDELLITGVCGMAAIARSQSGLGKLHKGGPRVPADRQAWGTQKLALYRAELKALPTFENYHTWPKS